MIFNSKLVIGKNICENWIEHYHIYRSNFLDNAIFYRTNDNFNYDNYNWLYRNIINYRVAYLKNNVVLLTFESDKERLYFIMSI